MYNNSIAAKRASSTQTSIPSGVDTLVTTGTVSYNFGMTTTTANTITVIVPGLYLIGGAADWDTGAADASYFTLLRVNGATIVKAGYALSAAISNAPSGFVSAPVSLAAGDLITLAANQNTGAAHNSGNNGLSTFLWALLLGRT
jgi:hypothetical protein